MYLVFILIFILSLVLVYLVKHYAADIGLIDVPNERSTHSCDSFGTSCFLF
jgi:UDP-N-acetylmuramyl pentapeptide phosphotransferase/UDP-N-acetylglucosamine-1-phosphate transferase